ncbi:MAG: energy transducer TonB [Candidatus Latescibacterota bacterium]
MNRKRTESNLHRQSPRIFVVCFAAAAAFTALLITLPLPRIDSAERKVTPPPVIIRLQNIPETRQVMRTPAPPKPFIPRALPIAADEILPDRITIDDTKLDLAEAPVAPEAILMPESGAAGVPSAAEEEEEIYEYFSVEEPPKRKNTVSPEYPEMAKRAEIEGTVLLKALVNRTGAVDSVEVQSGPSIFHKPAIAAAKATSFTPARQNDKAVSCWVVMPFRFVVTKK